MTRNNTPQPDSHAIAEKFCKHLFNDSVIHKTVGRKIAAIILASHAETLGISPSDIEELWSDRLES